MEKDILIYHAFTERVFKGNPAGVVLGAEDLEEKDMKKIAKELGYPETAFIYLDQDPLKVRFFTPKEEVDLCGHATIAYVTGLIERNIWELKEGKNIKEVETNLGKLPIIIEKFGKDKKIMMYQASPQIEKIENLSFWKNEIKKAIKIDEGDFLDEFEIVKAYTGIWDLMIGVKNRDILNKINVDMELIKEVSKKLKIISFHIFTLENDEIYARNMAPIVDIPGEAATGTSNGALIYYLYTLNKIKADEMIKITQGETMGRKSEIFGKIELEDGVKVLIGGKAVRFISGKININKE